jgi:hypothetical protein
VLLQSAAPSLILLHSGLSQLCPVRTWKVPWDGGELADLALLDQNVSSVQRVVVMKQLYLSKTNHEAAPNKLVDTHMGVKQIQHERRGCTQYRVTGGRTANEGGENRNINEHRGDGAKGQGVGE